MARSRSRPTETRRSLIQHDRAECRQSPRILPQGRDSTIYTAWTVLGSSNGDSQILRRRVQYPNVFSRVGWLRSQACVRSSTLPAVYRHDEVALAWRTTTAWNGSNATITRGRLFIQNTRYTMQHRTSTAIIAATMAYSTQRYHS